MGQIQTYQQQLREASSAATPLSIQAGDSKGFYGRETESRIFNLGGYRGIVDYSPTELVLTARAGTPLADIETILAGENQMLPFEPPHFGSTATLGGTIACGLSGPRRPYAGAARDHVLGINCLNGKGELLRFGGQVMKNVAGYDLARTLTGSLGTLAVLLDITIKVLPRPEYELTLAYENSPEQAVRQMNLWAGRPLPLSAGCHIEDHMHVRLSGFEPGVTAAAKRLGGETVTDGDTFWQALREHRLAFFEDGDPLWRVSVPPATGPLRLEADCLVDWGGALRWLKTPLSAPVVRQAAEAAGGHATLFRGGERDAVFHPLPAPLLALHQRLKQSFDPAGILNPGRMYAEF